MPERMKRSRKLTAEEAAELKAARAEFSSKPSMQQLLSTGEYIGPMCLDEYLSWRKGAGDAPLSHQLKAAIAATNQSLYSIALGSGIAAPVLQRFVNGERGITLETAGKVADYLRLALLPTPDK
jgi:hypothetical protein